MPFDQLKMLTLTDLDAHEIAPGLWQGSRPPLGGKLKEFGFNLVVLCAEEWQKANLYKDIEVILAPNNDDYTRLPTKQELDLALSAAKKVAQSVQRGRAALVTCWQGWNRSGLVSALALHLLTGQDGISCIAAVQAARPYALGNPGFRKVLSTLKSKVPPAL